MQITLNIEHERIPLNVSTTQEEKLYRDASMHIQQHLQSLRKRYAGLSEQTYYVMAMLENEVTTQQERDRLSAAPLMQLVRQLDQDVADALNNTTTQS